MRKTADRVVQARRSADQARSRFNTSLAAVKDRVQPSHLMHDAVQGVTSRGKSAAGQTFGSMLAHPLATTFVASFIGILFKRRPILFLVAEFLWARAWRKKSPASGANPTAGKAAGAPFHPADTKLREEEIA